MNKKNLFPIVALTVIGVVVAALLAVINMITAPIVAEAEREAILASLYEVMPGGDFGDEIVAEEPEEDAPETVQAIYRTQNGMGDVVVLKAQGYASVISITVGIDAQGKITKAIVTSEQESHGKADMKYYTDRFAGLNAGGVASAEPYSGATVTSDAIKNALVDAMYALGYATSAGSGSSGGAQTQLPRTDEELRNIAAGYVGGDVVEVQLDENAPATLKRLYYHEASGSYIAYNITSTQYVAVETEGFIVINNRGYIEKIDMPTWTVGHDVYPEESFVKSFIGKDRNNIIAADLVSGATGTSENFTVAVHEALWYVYDGSLSGASIVGIILADLAVIATAVCITVYKLRRRKR